MEQYTEQGLEQSLKLFQQATQADPEFAPAWAGLADANIRLMDKLNQPYATRLADARNAATKAIALDDANGEAHAALGWILLSKDWNFRIGTQHLKRATQLDPLRVFHHIFYSQGLTILGNFDGAQAAVEAARARLPPIPEVLFQHGCSIAPPSPTQAWVRRIKLLNGWKKLAQIAMAHSPSCRTMLVSIR